MRMLLTYTISFLRDYKIINLSIDFQILMCVCVCNHSVT